ncbi:MAG TPA: hypothetical protein VE991_11030, partial [Acidimicrobiales bacterium]|nr:hypothetical protein [Acidimicrobiales bacterium]
GAGAPAFSYGIAAYPEDGMTAATLIAAADVAMYRGRAARRAPAHVELLAVEMSRPWVTKALVTAMAGLVLMSGVAFARAVARGAPTPAPRASGPTPTLPFPVTAPSQGVAPAGGAPVATGPVSSGPAASAPAPAVTVVRTQPTSVGGSAPGSGSTAVMGLTPATGAPASSTLGTVPVSVPVAVPTPPPSTTPAPSGGLVGSVVGGTVAVVGGTVGGVLGIL